ncbi:hypothetical protein DVH24_006451 [Malus domestica]|uniref:C-JID domain-containing protein n=1 Tax=Malus domestica TaxID=3750 RepID=A0A498KFK1_MALDO|nr:hypothetical protein DVH24_006451 [Malus domestica]
MDEAQIRIMRVVTIMREVTTEYLLWPKINVGCLGKEIPNWFSYQSEGSSVNIKLRPDWFQTSLLGFALSTVVSRLQSRKLISLKKFTGESHELFTSEIFIPSSGHEHHIHVWNEAFRSEDIGKNRSPDVYKLAKEASIYFCLVVSKG